MTLSTDPPECGFLDAPVCTRPGDAEADFAVLGIPHGMPYNMAGVHSDAANAPTAFRHRTRRFARQIEHFDFDLGGPLFGDTGARLVDCGNVPADPRDLDTNKQRATDTVAALLSRGVTPIVLGGDDSVPTLVMRAFQPYGPVNVLQIDAHIDYRDEIHGIRDGYSSPMRRIREMPWVGAVVQVGMRGVGSARPIDVYDARRAGNVIVTAAEIRETGTHAVTTHLSDDAPWFVTIDVDGLDPTIAPGTSVPLPGGLDFAEAAGILRWLAEHRTFAGMDIVEHFPSLDVRDMTSITLGRLVMNVLGLSARRRAQPDGRDQE